VLHSNFLAICCITDFFLGEFGTFGGNFPPPQRRLDKTLHCRQCTHDCSSGDTRQTQFQVVYLHYLYRLIVTQSTGHSTSVTVKVDGTLRSDNKPTLSNVFDFCNVLFVAKGQKAQDIYFNSVHHDLDCHPSYSVSAGMSVHEDHWWSLCTLGRCGQDDGIFIIFRCISSAAGADDFLLFSHCPRINYEGNNYYGHSEFYY